jgi:hypothetical protein
MVATLAVDTLFATFIELFFQAQYATESEFTIKSSSDVGSGGMGSAAGVWLLDAQPETMNAMANATAKYLAFARMVEIID